MKLLGLVATVVLVFALGAASFWSPTAFWAGLAWTVSSVYLLAAFIRAVLCRGDVRSWWVGFAVVGATYFVLTYNHAPLEFVEASMPTTRAFDRLYLAYNTEPLRTALNSPVDTWDTLNSQPGNQGAGTYFNINQIHFRWAWHSLLVIVFGAIGGYTGVRLARLSPLKLPRSLTNRSILSLMATILVLAGLFSALHTPSALTLNTTFGLLAFSLAWAGLEAMLSRGRRRVFWAGYALFAWVYLFAAFGQFEVRLLVYGEAPAAGYLPTSRLLGELFPRLHTELPASAGMRSTWNPSYHRPDRLAPKYLHQLNRYFFVRIGHSLFGIMAGVLGGAIAVLSRDRHRFTA